MFIFHLCARALRKGIVEAKQKTKLLGYFSIHCCIKKIFSPYAHPKREVDNYKELQHAMKVGAKAIKKARKEKCFVKKV